ncbi:MAG: hypothetical protein F6K54_07675 [Okeania sp. SIO3B5]|uniref:hypothetical protein n=1 Tax=Okeania sp. SIO3B5 TaxID=2607811 RepID=UPI0013FE697F|nr:hypothetical protein [Okeania sp. SIO3B5]NEO52968.1 hypothetical protein [Okeania sp. SIO3B5]
MKERAIEDYIYLGSSVHFIKNITKNQSLRDNNTGNSDTYSTLLVIELLLKKIEDLGFTNTIDSVAFKQLREINIELEKSSKISDEQVNRLRGIAENLESFLHEECNQKSIIELDSEEKLPMNSHPPNDDNDDWKKSIADYPKQHPVLTFLLMAIILGLIGFAFHLVGKGLITFPDKLEPTNPEEENSLVTVNLFCSWKSQGNLTKPIEAAAVTATSMRTGNSINVLGKGIDSDGRITLEMEKNDRVSVTIRHPDIRDSQVTIPNIIINKNESRLKEQNYTVSRTNCYFDRKQP